MPATYEPIATTTLSSAATTITFSSIPGTYTDLRLVASCVFVSGTQVRIRFNSDTGSNYSRTLILGDGTSAISDRNSNQSTYTPSRDPFSSNQLFTFDIFSYAGSTNKSLLSTASQDANGSGNIVNGVGLWRNTGAITSIDFFSADANTLASGTTVTLYGILKA